MGRRAARITDNHICLRLASPITPHTGGPIAGGCPTVIIGGQFAARVGDQALCNGPPDMISVGCPTVLIGGMPAARMGDNTLHGGMITSGCETVLIGEEGVGTRGDIEDADPEQARMILKGHIDAVPMIDGAIARLKAGKSAPDPLINQYFRINGTGPDDQGKLNQLIGKYQKMQAAMADIGYEAEEEDPKSKNNAHVWKFGDTGFGNVHVNFPQFANRTERNRAETIVHEVSHRIVDSDDNAYEGGKKWDGMSQDEQMDNGDSLSSFARDTK
jgi:uncharacterized Zn-binding protein involved in type VI secretion